MKLLLSFVIKECNFYNHWNFLLGLIADLYINTLTVFRFNKMKRD